MFVDFLFKKYQNGFYVHLSEESRVTNKQKIAKYVANGQVVEVLQRVVFGDAKEILRLFRADSGGGDEISSAFMAAYFWFLMPTSVPDDTSIAVPLESVTTSPPITSGSPLRQYRTPSPGYT